MKFKRQILFLLAVLLISLVIAPFIKSIEGFKGINTDTYGVYPKSVDGPILDDYPLKNNQDAENNSVKDMWKQFPTFSLPSYKQITNNLKYYKTPDNGTCTPPIFCNALYGEKNIQSNEIHTLPPVSDGPGSRVGYFRSDTII